MPTQTNVMMKRQKEKISDNSFLNQTHRFMTGDQISWGLRGLQIDFRTKKIMVVRPMDQQCPWKKKNILWKFNPNNCDMLYFLQYRQSVHQIAPSKEITHCLSVPQNQRGKRLHNMQFFLVCRDHVLKLPGPETWAFGTSSNR